MASAAPLPVILRNGQAHVAATALERETGIVIKSMPGVGGFVACDASRCARLKSVLVEGDTLLAPVPDLGAALDLAVSFDSNRSHVTLVPSSRQSSASTGPATVGAVAPNLLLTLLDGTPVSLDELRGQRVLINSWASW